VLSRSQEREVQLHALLRRIGLVVTYAQGLSHHMGTGEDMLFPYQKPSAYHLASSAPYPDNAGLELKL
jgi:hypothetical protein